MEVIARKDAKLHGLKRYFTGKPCKYGHVSERYTLKGVCCDCHALQYDKYLTDNADKERTRKASWMKDFRDNMSQEDRDNYNASFYRRYPASYKANARKRLNACRLATPPWVDNAALTEIYKNCPEGHHVDHIHPLKGKNFSGLHVPWNLQYLPAAENLIKGNRIQPEDLNAVF
jgi:hypothetical protein